MSEQTDAAANRRVSEGLARAEGLLQQVLDTFGHWIDGHPQLIDPIGEFLAERDDKETR